MLLCHRQRFHLDTFRMVLSLQATLDAQDKDGNTGTESSYRQAGALHSSSVAAAV